MQEKDTIALLHQRAEEEYRMWQKYYEEGSSAYQRVCYDNIYLAIKNGEWDKYASGFTYAMHPILNIYNELSQTEDFIYSGIVDFINFRLEEKSKRRCE